MLTKFVGAIAVTLIVLTAGMLWVPGEASAAIGSFTFKPRSIDCEVTVAGGGPKTVNDAVICAVNLKEIQGFCKNPNHKSDTSNSHLFELQGAAIKTAGSNTWVKTQNGLQTNTISITNEDILHIVDLWNAEHPNDIINLITGDCPNGNWFWEWRVSKADAVLTQVKIPDPGSVSYKATTNCRDVTLPNGTTEHVCDFDGIPFEDCNRTYSKLEVKDGAGNVQNPLTTNYRINDCYLWRDVNKDNAFNLSKYGSTTYTPDINHIVAPQTGNVDGGDDDDLGGLVLVAPYIYYTGTCHQHGRENGSGTFQQLGPKTPTYNTDGTIVPLTGDIKCTGGSQLLDGTYP